MPSRPRINVTNSQAWGRLIKSWATGRDYVGHNPTNEKPFPEEPAPGAPPVHARPKSYEEFVQQCMDADVGLYFEDPQNDDPHLTVGERMGFVMLQATSDTVLVRLPSKEKIHESEARLLGDPAAVPPVPGIEYSLPDFYHELFTGPARPLDNKGKAILHADRIGEYTINTCM